MKPSAQPLGQKSVSKAFTSSQIGLQDLLHAVPGASWWRRAVQWGNLRSDRCIFRQPSPQHSPDFKIGQTRVRSAKFQEYVVHCRFSVDSNQSGSALARLFYFVAGQNFVESFEERNRRQCGLYQGGGGCPYLRWPTHSKDNNPFKFDSNLLHRVWTPAIYQKDLRLEPLFHMSVGEWAIYFRCQMLPGTGMLHMVYYNARFEVWKGQAGFTNVDKMIAHLSAY